MLKKLFIIKLKDELRSKVREEFKKISKKMDEEELERISDILDKEDIEIDDVNDILVDYLPYLCDDDDLTRLVRDDDFVKKVDKYIIYYIYIYLSEGNNKDVNFIMNKLGYKYKINDVILVDKYIKYANNITYDKFFEVVNKLYDMEKEDSLFKDKLDDFVRFNDMVKSGVFPYELVNVFYNIKQNKNLYRQLIDIEWLYKNVDKIQDKKNLLMIYYTYNYKIDFSVDEYFLDVNLELDDIINFVRNCEAREFFLNEKQIDNLLKSFKKRYYIKNGLVDEYKRLSRKVIGEYSDYYDKHYYFGNEEFIKYYNDKYKDNFNIFLFSKNGEIELNNNILSSLLTNSSLLENYYLICPLVKELSTFKVIDNKREQCDREERNFINKRKKFYRKNKCKINAYLKNDRDCIKYFALKNVSKEDREEFYKLFRIICGDNYKEIGFDVKKVRYSADSLKEDFLVDLFNVRYKDRFVVVDRYKEYVKYIGGDSYIKDNYFEYTMEEYERRFNIVIAKDIIKRFRMCNSDVELVKVYENVLAYVKNDLLIENIDVIFGRLAKKKYVDLKSEYDSFKSRYLMKKMTGGLVKRRCVK